MNMNDEVKLYGAWPSTFTYRVIWALKLKGIQFEFINEDLSNKSPQLIQHNPVYKRTPVLVHRGRSVCESMVILEYIDEQWPQQRCLLPSDPYERAQARFWINYFEDKGRSIRTVFETTGKEQEKARMDVLEMLAVIEQHGLNREKKFFGGDDVSIVDIAFGLLAHWLGVIEEVSERKLIMEDELPLLKAWIHNFKNAPVIKENSPNREEMLPIFRLGRAKIIQPPA